MCLTQVFTVVAATCSQLDRAEPRVVVGGGDPMRIRLSRCSPRSTCGARARPPTSRSTAWRYGVFAHDWRVEPAHEWLRLKAERASRIT